MMLVTYSLVLMFGAKVLDLPSMFSKRNELQSSIMPVVCLSLSSIAHYAMWTRRYMVDELKEYPMRSAFSGEYSTNRNSSSCLLAIIGYPPFR